MDPASFILPALQFFGTLAGNGKAFDSNKLQMQSAINYNWATRLADYQFDLQRKQFDYTNEFNLPANQVQRLIDANLNPNLAYGSGSVVGSTGSMPSVSQPRMNQVDPAALLQYQLQSKQLAIQSAQAMANILKTEEETKGIQIQNKKNEGTLPYDIELANNLAAKSGWLADIAKNDYFVSEFNRRTEMEIYNVKQLLLHGLDGDFKFDSSFSPDNSEQVRIYLNDLQESDLYNSIKSIWMRDKLSVDELNKKIAILQGEIERLPDLAMKYHGDALVSKWKGELAQMGVNPDDPLWARAILALIGGENIISSVGGVIKNWSWSDFWHGFKHPFGIGLSK